MHKLSTFLSIIAISLFFNADIYAQSVTLSGECVGIKVYTDGLIVTNTESITTNDNKKFDIAKGYGIKKGDIIKKVNGCDAVSAKVISDALEGGNEITLTVLRNDALRDVKVSPAITDDGAKLGLWLRDSTAGLGTITCYLDDKFIALGHGICDIDTGNIMPVKYGIIQNCSQIKIEKGVSGFPGAITGNIDKEQIGTVSKNTRAGIYGKVNSPPQNKTSMEVAANSEIKKGAAKILADIDGEGVKEYEIEIKRIALPSANGKDMVVEITDKALLEKTGGIVQGMSGSPIIQNSKLIGAITHVFINEPARGYGIFIENMLAEAEKIK